MGGLVSTVATRIIVHHLNKTFSLQRLHHIRNDPPLNDPAGNGQTIAAYFAPAAGHDLLWLSQNIKHNVSQRPDNRLFLPEDFGVRSPNAEARWKYFLTVANASVLTPVNHAAIISLIYQGLTAFIPLIGGGTRLVYNRIQFDCVDDAQIAGNLGQHVLGASEIEDDGTSCYKIVLVTPPMPVLTGVAGLELDPQPNP
jgi:hypothetical protein